MGDRRLMAKLTPQEYISYLSEQTRLERLRKQDAEKNDRSKGFTTYFSGANAAKEKPRAKLREKKSSKPRKRRGWGTGAAVSGVTPRLRLVGEGEASRNARRNLRNEPEGMFQPNIVSFPRQRAKWGGKSIKIVETPRMTKSSEDGRETYDHQKAFEHGISMAKNAMPEDTSSAPSGRMEANQGGGRSLETTQDKLLSQSNDIRLNTDPGDIKENFEKEQAADASRYTKPPVIEHDAVTPILNRRRRKETSKFSRLPDVVDMAKAPAETEAKDPMMPCNLGGGGDISEPDHQIDREQIQVDPSNDQPSLTFALDQQASLPPDEGAKSIQVSEPHEGQGQKRDEKASCNSSVQDDDYENDFDEDLKQSPLKVIPAQNNSFVPSDLSKLYYTSASGPTEVIEEVKDNGRENIKETKSDTSPTKYPGTNKVPEILESLSASISSHKPINLPEYMKDHEIPEKLRSSLEMYLEHKQKIKPPPLDIPRISGQSLFSSSIMEGNAEDLNPRKSQSIETELTPLNWRIKFGPQPSVSPTVVSTDSDSGKLCRNGRQGPIANESTSSRLSTPRKSNLLDIFENQRFDLAGRMLISKSAKNAQTLDNGISKKKDPGFCTGSERNKLKCISEESGIIIKGGAGGENCDDRQARFNHSKIFGGSADKNSSSNRRSDDAQIAYREKAHGKVVKKDASTPAAAGTYKPYNEGTKSKIRIARGQDALIEMTPQESSDSNLSVDHMAHAVANKMKHMPKIKAKFLFDLIRAFERHIRDVSGEPKDIASDIEFFERWLRERRLEQLSEAPDKKKTIEGAIKGGEEQPNLAHMLGQGCQDDSVAPANEAGSRLKRKFAVSDLTDGSCFSTWNRKKNAIRSKCIGGDPFQDTKVVVIQLAAYSSWGDPEAVGLTELKILDGNENEIPLAPGNIRIRYAHCNRASLAKLLNKKVMTTNKRHMWEAPLPLSLRAGAIVELVITIAVKYQPRILRLWNYNCNEVIENNRARDAESITALQRGMREIIVSVNGKHSWKGELPRAFGTVIKPYNFDIGLLENQPLSESEIKRASDISAALGGPREHAFENQSKDRGDKSKENKFRRVASMPGVTCAPLDLSEVETSPEGQKTYPKMKRNRSVPLEEAKATRNLSENSKPSDTQHAEAWTLNKPGDEIDDEIDLYKSRESIHQFNLKNAGRLLTDPGQSSEDTFRDFSELPSSVEIPTLPYGSVLDIRILTTWGDTHYVGMTSVEVFDDKCQAIKGMEAALLSDQKSLKDASSDSNPDPRVAMNLVDGTNCTCDELHMWLASLKDGPKSRIGVRIKLPNPCKVSMIRIWNYNRSRQHVSRGARHVCISLDGEYIFRGEIAAAPGNLKTAAQRAEPILFTSEKDMIEKLSAIPSASPPNLATGGKVLCTSQQRRPELRPPTRRVSQHKDESKGFMEVANKEGDEDAPSMKEAEGRIQGKVIMLLIEENWGDPHYVGLTGVEILGYQLKPLQCKMQVNAFPRDLNAIPGHTGDTRTLDKLLDGLNNTCDDNHMWLAPKLRNPGKGEKPRQFLQFTLQKQYELGGIRIWNYNKNQKDARRGIKRCRVLIDGKDYSPSSGQIFRRGPGKSEIDFGQIIRFKHPDLYLSVARESVRITGYSQATFYVPPVLPVGYVLRIELHETWGDPYYVGLNGLEIYDQENKLIPLSPTNVTAIPHSVRVFSDCKDDVRTPDKLIDGVNDCSDSSHMWLAPFQSPEDGHAEATKIIVTFDVPVIISYVKIWNYSKTPARGARGIMIFLDDSLMYNGPLRKCLVDTSNLGQDEKPKLITQAQSIIFSDDRDLWHSERKNILAEDITLLNGNVRLIRDGEEVPAKRQKSSSQGVKMHGHREDPQRELSTSKGKATRPRTASSTHELLR